MHIYVILIYCIWFYSLFIISLFIISVINRKIRLRISCKYPYIFACTNLIFLQTISKVSYRS